MADRLRSLWDFDDLDATERRFRDRLAAEADGGPRAEVLTQIARVHGLRGDFDEGERVLEDAEASAGESPAAQVRIDLERGRLRRSSGDRKAALPLFESAFEAASEAGELDLAADAAHMAALAAPDRDGFISWTARGLELVDSADASVRYWLGPLLNNLGWEHYEAGAYDDALDAFERALRERERDPEQSEAIEIARYALGKTLRALERPAEAAAQLEHAVRWAEREGRPDGWFHEELAEDYAALGRTADAREQARHALELLPAADSTFDLDGERAARLRRLAEAT
ncbi:MAG: tetratricopeptide repeat protein [Gaiellaceae bacterium]